MREHACGDTGVGASKLSTGIVLRFLLETKKQKGEKAKQLIRKQS